MDLHRRSGSFGLALACISSLLLFTGCSPRRTYSCTDGKFSLTLHKARGFDMVCADAWLALNSEALKAGEVADISRMTCAADGKQARVCFSDEEIVPPIPKSVSRMKCRARQFQEHEQAQMAKKVEQAVKMMEHIWGKNTVERKKKIDQIIKQADKEVTKNAADEVAMDADNGPIAGVTQQQMRSVKANLSASLQAGGSGAKPNVTPKVDKPNVIPKPVDAMLREVLKRDEPWQWQRCLAQTSAGFDTPQDVTVLGQGAFGQVIGHEFKGYQFVEKAISPPVQKGLQDVMLKMQNQETFKRHLESSISRLNKMTPQNECTMMNRVFYEMGDYALPCLNVEVDSSGAASLLMPRLKDSLQGVERQGILEFSPLQTAIFALDLARFAYAMERAGVRHGDLHSGNVLVMYANGAFRFKLGDFGLAEEEQNVPPEMAKMKDMIRIGLILEEHKWVVPPSIAKHPFFSLWPAEMPSMMELTDPTKTLDSHKIPDAASAYDGALDLVFDTVLDFVSQLSLPLASSIPGNAYKKAKAWQVFHQATRPALDETNPFPPADFLQCVGVLRCLPYHRGHRYHIDLSAYDQKSPFGTRRLWWHFETRWLEAHYANDSNFGPIWPRNSNFVPTF